MRKLADEPRAADEPTRSCTESRVSLRRTRRPPEPSGPDGRFTRLLEAEELVAALLPADDAMNQVLGGNTDSQRRLLGTPRVALAGARRLHGDCFHRRRVGRVGLRGGDAPADGAERGSHE